MAETSGSGLRARATNRQNDGSTQQEAPPTRSRRRTLTHRLQNEWDSLLWIIAAFGTLYFTNFATTLLFDTQVKRVWLDVSLVSLAASVGCSVYAGLYRPGLSTRNWQTDAPVLIPVATATGLSGWVCFAVAVWPVWGLYTLLILSVLFMGFISTVSLLG